MEYTITTLQYGEMKDTYTHKTLDSLLNDLANIETMKTVQILDISKNGKSFSKTRIKILHSLLRA